ncbi:MAG: chorismate mutase [Pseudomonadota bacterium]
MAGTPPKPPHDCTSMDDVRAEIDRVDRALVDLLAERWGYVDRMWHFKRQQAAAASVPWRNRDVIEKVRGRAEATGMPPELAEGLWRLIIGWGVQYQEERLRDD